MISWFKKHFIPHEGNDQSPHILRDYSTQSIIIVVLFLEVFSFLLPTITRTNTTGNMAAVLPAVLADLTNQERQAQDLPTLAVSPILNQAAEMKAVDMATKGYFAHISPDGKTPWYWLAQVGYQYQYAGENLAVNFTDSKDVTDAWMNSAIHKENIVKENYTEIGTAVASGIYQGKEATFVVQVYANPLLATAQTEPNKEATKTTTDNVSNIINTKTINIAEVNKVPVNILGAETVNLDNAQNLQIKNPTFFQKAFASPRNTTNMILYIVFGIIFIALILYILIKNKNHHRNLITNGLIILAIILAIFSANYYLSHRSMVITQSLDYSNQNK